MRAGPPSPPGPARHQARAQPVRPDQPPAPHRYPGRHHHRHHGRHQLPGQHRAYLPRSRPGRRRRDHHRAPGPARRRTACSRERQPRPAIPRPRRPMGHQLPAPRAPPGSPSIATPATATSGSSPPPTSPPCAPDCTTQKQRTPTSRPGRTSPSADTVSRQASGTDSLFSMLRIGCSDGSRMISIGPACRGPRAAGTSLKTQPVVFGLAVKIAGGDLISVAAEACSISAGPTLARGRRSGPGP